MKKGRLAFDILSREELLSLLLVLGIILTGIAVYLFRR